MRYGIYLVIGIVALVGGGVLAYYGIAALEPETYAPERITATLATTTPLEVPLPAPIVTAQPLFSALATTTARVFVLRAAREDEVAAYQSAVNTSHAEVQAANLGMEDTHAFPLSKTELLVTTPGSAYTESSAWIYNPKTATLAPIAVNKPGLLVRALGEGKYFLIFTSSRDGVNLSFRNRATNRDTRLVYTTLPHKCALGGVGDLILYCAVPKSIPESAVLPDDYFKRKWYTTDRIVQINFTASEAMQIVNPTTTIDVYNAEVVSNTFMFMNRLDNKVYAIDIAE